MSTEELLSLSDAELARISAEEVMGWKKDKLGAYWVTPEDRVIRISEWTPTFDRNQSGELLAKMAEKGVNFVSVHSATIRQLSWLFNLDKDGVGCLFGDIKGTDARSETVAAILAARALRGTDADPS